MPRKVDHTTLLCLFHHDDQAKAALNELQDAGVPRSAISVLGSDGDRKDSLAGLGVPRRDLAHLKQGLADGGTIVVVKALTEHVEDVERIFAKHRAEKIDEAETEPATKTAAPEAIAASIPVVALGGAALPVLHGAYEDRGVSEPDDEALPTVQPVAGLPLLHGAYEDRGVSEPDTDTYIGEDESEATTLDDEGLIRESPETVLLVSRSEIASGEADVALAALQADALTPVEVLLVPDAPRPRTPVLPMEPASRYRQVD